MLCSILEHVAQNLPLGWNYCLLSSCMNSNDFSKKHVLSPSSSTEGLSTSSAQILNVSSCVIELKT